MCLNWVVLARSPCMNKDVSYDLLMCFSCEGLLHAACLPALFSSIPHFDFPPLTCICIVMVLPAFLDLVSFLIFCHFLDLVSPFTILQLPSALHVFASLLV